MQFAPKIAKIDINSYPHGPAFSRTMNLTADTITTDLNGDKVATSATQRAYRQLRQRIITGLIKPGQRLKVGQLKIDLNIGASPIREALSLLTSDQLVERIDQRGFRTATANQAQFNEILRLRSQFEAMALQEAIESGDTDWEESIVLAHHHLSRCSREDIEDFEHRHKQFHMALLSACSSKILLRFCDQLYDLNIRYRFLAGRSTIYKKRDVSLEHRAIVEASIDRDAVTACAELRLHYSRTGEFLTGLFDQVATRE